MSNSMGIASAFVLSSLFLSPLAMAEESLTFATRNAERAAAFEAYQGEMTAKAEDAGQTPQASTLHAQPEAGKDS